MGCFIYGGCTLLQGILNIMKLLFENWRKYLKEEKDAEHYGRGLWKGTFERPEEWRKKNK